MPDSPAARGPRSLLTPAALHILMSLAEGARHGYRIKLDVEERTAGSLSLGPGTLYEAIHRMLRDGWIAEAPVQGEEASRRKTYRITADGRSRMEAELERLEDIVQYARGRALLPDGGGMG